ncbi:hypothetical protein B0O99DRAFT_470567, partial [Bisporella sp. PMI_857]
GSPAQSMSPSISASAGLSSGQASPASFIYKKEPPPTSSFYFPRPSFAPSMQQAQGAGGPQFQTSSASGTEGPYSAPPSSVSVTTSAKHSRRGTDPSQFMTITTSQGVFSVPIDVHQASRLADEKRARNAGASARFRQRRKEKEKEASTTIEKMQQQNRELERRIREAESERDFYREERDRFRDVLDRSKDLRDLAMQAPPSPQSMRATSFARQTASDGPPPPPPGYQQDPSTSETAPRRRRTDTSGDFTNMPYTLPPPSTI